MAASFGHVAPGGTLVFVGLTTQEIRFPQPVFHRPEISLLASRNALPEEFRRILRLLEDGAIDPAPWISRHVGFRELPQAFGPVTDPAAGTVKALVRMD
jgi:alcohol dehydrogenase